MISNLSNSFGNTDRAAWATFYQPLLVRLFPLWSVVKLIIAHGWHFYQVCNFPWAMKTPNLEIPYVAKRCDRAIVSILHFPDDKFHEILTKTTCGQAVYFVVMTDNSSATLVLVHHNASHSQHAKFEHNPCGISPTMLTQNLPPYCPPFCTLILRRVSWTLSKISINGWQCFRCT